MDATGMSYEIATRSQDLLLRWLDEILPHAFVPGRPGVDDFEAIWPRVIVWPMWAWKPGPPTDPDWLCDSRVLGRLDELRAKTGTEGVNELLRIRRELQQELASYGG
jgi:hypothetical protein